MTKNQNFVPIAELVVQESCLSNLSYFENLRRTKTTIKRKHNGKFEYYSFCLE